MSTEHDPCCMLQPLGNATCNNPPVSPPADATLDATRDATTPLKAAATLVLERNKQCNKGATTTQKVRQQTTPENDPDRCLTPDMVIPPVAGPETPPDDDIRASVWDVWIQEDDGIYRVSAIRGHPVTRAEILKESPSAEDAEPRTLHGKPHTTAEPEEPPTVTCSACRHFEAGASPAAVGRCLTDAPSAKRQLPWAFARRHCVEFEAKQP